MNSKVHSKTVPVTDPVKKSAKCSSKHPTKATHAGKKSTAKELKPLSVTLLSGFLGAGKTTLLKNLLESTDHKMRIAVIVNDMAELNIDASLIKKSKLVQAKQEFISMQNGCICCTLRYDLIREIQKIYQLGTFDYLLIESTGIAEPMHVAENFVVNPDTESLVKDEGMMLHAFAKLDTCVTVVDASEFPQKVKSLHNFAQEYPSEVAKGDEKGFKSISQLLIDQIEFANVIILNKCDLIADKIKIDAEFIPLLKTLNPTAKIITTSHSRVDFHEIINTKLFSMDEAQNAAGWLQSLKSDHTISEKDEYGIFSFVYRARRPFNPLRLEALLKKFFIIDHPWERIVHAGKPNMNSYQPSEEVPQKRNGEAIEAKYGTILRSKGFCWVATRDSVMIEWNHHGSYLELHALMDWYCYTPEADWGMSEEEMAFIKKDFQSPFGDRRQEIVLIGINLQRELLIEEFNSCLLTDKEMQEFTSYLLTSSGIPGKGVTSLTMSDPLPPWPISLSSGGIVSLTLQEHEEKIVVLPPEMELCINQISLNLIYTDVESTIGVLDEVNGDSLFVSPVAAVKVWLDIAPSHNRAKKTILLCTLRPEKIEQVCTNVTLFVDPSEEGDNADDDEHDSDHLGAHAPAHNDGHGSAEDRLSLPMRLYLEVVNYKKRKSPADLTVPFEVHVVGTSRWNPADEMEQNEE